MPETPPPAEHGLRVLGVAPGDPWSPTTFSGIAPNLFAGIRRAGLRVGAVDGAPTPVLDTVAKLTTAWPDKPMWRERHQLSGVSRAAASLTGRRRAAAADPAPDVLLQIGAWYDLSGGALRPRLRASYHDGNLAVYLRRPDGVLDPGSRLVRRRLEYERRIYDGLDLILPMSEWLRRSFIEDFGQDPDKVVAVGGGANFDALPEAVPDRDFERVRILFVGKDFERKGGPELLTAFAAVRAAHPDAELWIVGPPRPPAPQPGVVWHEPVSRTAPGGSERLARLYADATLFAMPSRFEPFGIVFLEAMAYGLPCIAADTCAMPEIVEHGRTGLVAPPADADALAEVLLEAVSDPARLAGWAAAARETFLARWTWDHVGERVARLFVQRLENA